MMRVFSADQIKPLRMVGRWRSPPIAPGQQFSSPVHRSASIANHHQHTQQIANHVMKEGVTDKVDADQRTIAPKPDVLKTPDGRCRLTLCRSKGGKIMLTDQAL